MTENNADIKTEESKDTISTLFEERDCDSRNSEDRDRSKIKESGEASLLRKLQNPDKPSKKSSGNPKEENIDGRPSANDQLPVDSSEKEKILNKEDEDKTPLELEALRKKLEKT